MSESRSVFQILRALTPLASSLGKGKIFGLLVLTILMAVSELVITGLVALLAAVFGSPETALNRNPLLWFRTHLGVDFCNDARWLALGILCIILLAIVCKNLLATVHQWSMTAFSESMGNNARERLLQLFLRAPYLWVLRAGTSDILFGFSAGIMLGPTLLAVLQIFSNGLMVLTIFLGLVAVSPLPSLAFLCVLGLGGYLIVRVTRNMLNTRANAVYRADLEAHKIQQTVVHGLKEMRLYGRESAVFVAYSDKLCDVLIAKKWLQEKWVRKTGP